MKSKEIRNLDSLSAKEKILELKKELVKINAQISIGSSIKSPGQARKIKKTIARIITISHKTPNQIKETGGSKKA
jgi:ribosomal protein L29